MDDHWCTHCDKAISAFSNSLYCSEACLRADARNHSPSLGYKYTKLKNLPRVLPSIHYTLIPWAKLPGLEPVKRHPLF